MLASLSGSYSQMLWTAEVRPGNKLIPADDLLHDWTGGAQFKEVVAYLSRKCAHQCLGVAGPGDLGDAGGEVSTGLECEA
jgi:hypothetical protein